MLFASNDSLQKITADYILGGKMVNDRVMKIKSAVVGFKKIGDSDRIDYFAGEAAALHGHLENIHDKAC